MKEKNDKINRIIKYLQGKLDAKQKKELELLLQSDKESKDLLRLISLMQNQYKELHWSEIEKTVLNMSDKMFEDFQHNKKMKDKAYGITTFDSKQLPVPEGVRPATIDSRQLRYKIKEYVLDISLYPISVDSYEMIGQISGYEEDAIFNVTIKNSEVTFTVKTDIFQLFCFERIPAMKYQLSIKKGRKIIAFLDIEL